MIGRIRARTSRSARVALACAAALAAALAVGCGADYLEIPIETPIQPKLDVTPFQRVLVAGFVAGGSEDIDANQETVRLLRSQLRTKSSLKVIDADVFPLVDIAREQYKAASSAPEEPARENNPSATQSGNDHTAQPAQPAMMALPATIKDEKDIEPYERLFANTAYWKRIGEEYQNPLIVTGTVLFTPESRSGFVQTENEVYDNFGRRQVVPQRVYRERKGFVLRPKFIFIDGRTGATMYSESYREEVLYNAQTNTPALSSYFELMDRLVPNFLTALSSQKVKGTRVLLR
jgi:hypothetical protein